MHLTQQPDDTFIKTFEYLSLNELLNFSCVSKACRVKTSQTKDKVIYWHIQEMFRSVVGKEMYPLLEVLKQTTLCFRVCGGSVADMLRGKDYREINDVDILFVCGADKGRSLCSLLHQLPYCVSINRDTNIRSSGGVHDIKLYKDYVTHNHLVDLVSRVEVDECTWVDADTFKSGMYWDGMNMWFEVYNPYCIKDNVLLAQAHMSSERKEKMKKKGYKVVSGCTCV